MKQISIAVAVVLLAAFILSGPGIAGDETAENGTEVTWLDYDTGLAKAKTENKHVFIDFTAEWCGWCKKMEKEVFTDSQVATLLNSDFISVRVDGDSQKQLDIEGYKITEKNLAKAEFRVQGYPTFWFLKPDGTKLGNLRGYQSKDVMLKALTYVKDYAYDTTKTKDPDTKK